MSQVHATPSSSNLSSSTPSSSVTNRREFVRRTAMMSAVAAGMDAVPSTVLGLDSQLGSDSQKKLSPGRLRLSLSAYSLRSLLTKPSDGMDLFQLVDYCHAHDVAGVELTSYYFPKEVTTEYLAELKHHCHRRGVTISGGAIANDFCQRDQAKIERDIEHAIRWIDHYSFLGAPVIRIFAGTQPSDDSWDATIQRCTTACNRLGLYAQSKGMLLGLENHGGVTAKAEGLLQILGGIQSKSIGVNFDSGNFRSTSDPYLELEQIAPYAVNAQLKVEMFPNGKREDADIARILSILRTANYSGWVALEYEAEEPPLTAIPKWLEAIKQLIG